MSIIEIPSPTRIAEWDSIPDGMLPYQKPSDSPITIPKWVLHENNFKAVLARNWDKIRPVTAEFVTTLNCNFRCAQCSYAEPKKELGVWVDEDSKRFQSNFSRNDLHMTQKTMRTVIDRLVDGGVKNILFTGGGEPFMNTPVTTKGMHYAREKGLNIGLYTNGSLLTPRSIDEILQTSPLFIRVSVYGSNRTNFSKYTRQTEQTYDQVIRNVQELARKKLSSNSKTQLGLSYLVHPYTINALGQFADVLLKSLSIDELEAINFCRFTPAVDYFDGKQHSPEMMGEAFQQIGEQVKPKLESAGIQALLYFHRLNDLHQPKSYTSCRASGWYLEVGPSGDAYLCCEKLFMPEYKIGNLVQQTVEEIYSGSRRKSVIDFVNSTGCSDCPPVCKPHELNKIFQSVESLVQAEKADLIRKWRKDLIKLGNNNGHFAGKLNDFES